jgi:S-adenosylmethionine decarboxylase
MSVESGCEWIVDAQGCDPAPLRSIAVLSALFDRAMRELTLRPVAPPQWHQFPGEGGITGVVLLTESHLACHTFPERGFAAFNLYCCRPRPAWAWEQRLAEALGATVVQVTAHPRGISTQVLTQASR